MASRREFLRDSAAAVTAAALPSVVSSFAAERAAAPLAPVAVDRAADRIPLLVLIDETLEEADCFMAAAARLGLPARVFAGDVGIAWMRDIEPRLASGPAKLAGFTSGPTSFCLEYLARSHGLRLVYRVEHERVDETGPRSQFRHRLAGTRELGPAIAELGRAGADWPSAAAAMVAGCSAHLEDAVPLELPDLAAGRPWSVSWLMASTRGP